MSEYNQISMDQINAYFSLEGRLQSLNVAPTATGGAGINNLDKFPAPKPAISAKPKHKGISYVQEYQQKAIQKQTMSRQKFDLPGGSTINILDLEDVEDISTAVGDLPGVSDLDEERTRQIYDTYFRNLPRTYDPEMTITSYKDEILTLMEINSVIIIQGPTGCGKTTQVPQYILDHCASKGTHCNIVVTQPRKIAAISIARRVCQERKWQLGTIVGYQVAMDPKVSADTRLSYVTTGVLLEKLVNAKRMDMFTHVIIDEVHERDQDIDFALLLVKKFLSTNCDKVKVILMSATFDSSMFSKYFALREAEAPIIQIGGKSKEVTEHYLLELKTLINRIPEFDMSRPTIDPCLYEAVNKLMYVFDRIEKAEQKIADDKDYAPSRGAVLIFLPGYDEISVLTNKLSTARFNKNYWILPLHSSITVEEQTKVFMDPPRDHRKVIISTNIAESSITVPDIKYVIDFCLTKCLATDPQTNYTCLQLEWASKANCIQRKGRAGRVDIGKVYRMVPKQFYEELPDYGVPEIKRCPLTNTILHIKKLDVCEPLEMLSFALEPPFQEDIHTAVLQLKEAFALISKNNNTYDGELTFVGHVMSNLPLDIKLSKLIIFGYAFNCLEECIIIAASLSLQSFFARPFDKPIEVYKSQLAWTENTCSDCLAYLYAYKWWKRMTDQGQFLRPGGMSEMEWCKSNYIQLKRIKEVDMLVKEIKSRLEKLNVLLERRRRPLNHEQEVLILKILMAGAFFPHYYLQEPLDEEEIMREINDNDPRSTVVLSGIPPNHGLLYACAIRDMLSCCNSKIDIEFEERKAYITFERNHEVTASTVLQAVYVAVKLGKLHKQKMRRPLELCVFSQEEADHKMEQIKQANKSSSEKLFTSNRFTVKLNPPSMLKKMPLPSLDQTIIRIFISHFIDCGHFWARLLTGEVDNHLKFLEASVNFSMRDLRPLCKKPEVNTLCLAPYAESKDSPVLYYRAQVQEIIEKKDVKVKVFFVDYGNVEIVRDSDLRAIDENVPDLLNTPALAFECFLSEVKPSSLKNPSGQWCREANIWCKNQVNGRCLKGKIYSVVQDTVRVQLLKEAEDKSIININQSLIDNKFAERCEESLISKQNHELRMRRHDYTSNFSLDNSTYSKPIQFSLEDAEECSVLRTTNRMITLHGPSNPLEAKYVGLTNMDSSKCVQVEGSSVNSVSFNAEPQDPCSILLVAAHVGVSQISDNIVLRNTTLMPKILGLPTLICLIFAPYVEIRTDKARKSYIGALCGLGFDPDTGEALYPEHDIEIAFDTEVTLEHISQINGVRMAFNMLLGTDGNLAGYSNESKCLLHEKLRKNLFQLLEMVRKPKTPEWYSHSSQWNQIPVHMLLDAQPEEIPQGSYLYVMPLHKPCGLLEDFDEMANHLQELLRIVNKSVTNNFQVIRCQLCSVDVVSSRDLLLHLDDDLHKQKEEAFERRMNA